MKEKPYYQLFSKLETDNWEVYPRPHLRRREWFCLNGIWKIKNKEGEKSIRVPFPPQAELSGYEVPSVLDVPEELLYERSFRTPAGYKSPHHRVILHIGAADQCAEVFVNGRPCCRHEGGYLPFSADITELLRPEGEENILNVLCIDRMDIRYPRGKQKKNHGGMWYTPVSGIWQTVWLERVPLHHIREAVIECIDRQQIRVSVELSEGCQEEISYRIHGPKLQMFGKSDKPVFTIPLEDIRLWEPEDPYLYQMELILGEDRVETYFALRWVEVKKIGGHHRMCLNGHPIFLKGVLDQGYFCDGLFLPANVEGYEQDILAMKELGFNLLRKHIKVEPELFYYACDRLGMLVMQDMVNNGPYSFLLDTALPTIGMTWRPGRSYDGGLPAERERKAIFIEHSREIIRKLRVHPSVIAYTIFNEGWGQFASDRVGDELRACDPSRLYDYTSGWFAGKNSDFDSIHNYFHPEILKQKDKPLLLSECGGYNWMLPEHSYSVKTSYGYGKAADRSSLMERIRSLYETMILPSVEEGLCGFIYTQLSDIEEEVNGMYTYDRKICKVDREEMRKLNNITL